MGFHGPTQSVLITDDVHPMMIEAFQRKGIRCAFRPAISYEEVKNNTPSYTGLIINSKINCNVEFIDLADRLKFIGRLGSGRSSRHPLCTVKGIGVYFSPEGNKNAVAEHAFSYVTRFIQSIDPG